MDKIISEKKKFSIIARAKSFSHAGRGVYIFIKTTHNSWIQILFSVILIGLGIFFRITNIEWAILIISSMILIIVEAINTAIEIDIDLTSPTYHPYAKDTKDVAAGAVLITSIMTLSVSLIILLPYLLKYIV